MKILFENKQLNEGPGAGYTVSGTLTNVKINRIVNYTVKDRDADVVEWIAEVIGSADFVDVHANSYYYGGTIDSTPVSIIRVAFEGEKEEPTVEDVKWALEKAKIEANLGGGWIHSTFDGYIDVDYNGIDNAPYTTGVEFKLTDQAAIDYLDRAVQNGNEETLYAVMDEDDWIMDSFETEEEAISFAKEHGLYKVQIVYQTEMFGDYDFDVDRGDVVWTADEDMEESLKESENNSSDVMKEIKWLLDGIIAIGPDDKINDQTDWKRLYTSASRIKKQLDKESSNIKESKSLTESFDEEDRIQALADYLGIDASEITNTYDYEYETPEGDYYVVDEYEARELAEQDIESLYDDLGIESFTPDFRDWIIRNALDNDWFEDAVRESMESYVEDIAYEDGRLEEELLEAGIITEEDVENGYDEDDAKEEYVVKLVYDAGHPVDYCADNFGWDWVTTMAFENNLIDMQAVIDECIDMDGIAHFIARYDGEEHDLGNGLYAYRTN